MNDDFISGLRADLIGAMQDYEHSPRTRMRVEWGPRTLRLAATAAAVAALVLAIVLAARHLPQRQHQPAKLRAVPIANIGGEPLIAAATGTTLWSADLNRRVVRVDLRTGDHTAISMPMYPEGITAGRDGVWARGAGSKEHSDILLVRIDPATGRTTKLVAQGGYIITAGGSGLWGDGMLPSGAGSIVRFDPATGRKLAELPSHLETSLAAGPDALWAVTWDGTVLRIDPHTARVAQQWDRVAPLRRGPDSPRVLAPERGGVWVLSTDKHALLEIRDGGVQRAVTVDPSVRPLLAMTRNALWVTAGDSLGGDNRVWRIDRATGHIAGIAMLGDRQPQTLVGTDAGLAIVTTLGQVLLLADG